MRNITEKRGITLIALVITVIVLLILAGISISMLAGNNGILQRATGAKEDTDIATIKEQAELVKHALIIDKRGESPTRSEVVTGINLDSYFSGSTLSGNIITTADEKYDILVNKDLSITVARHGEIEDTLEAGLYNAETGELIYSWDKLLELGNIITVNNGTLSRNAFNISSDISKVKLIIINDGTVTNISSMGGISKLKEVVIPENVTSISGNAFGGNQDLENINIPSAVTTINDSTFGGCSSLKSIELSKNVTSIGIQAFSGCSSLTSIELSENVTSIGEQAFSRLYKFKKCNN